MQHNPSGDKFLQQPCREISSSFWGWNPWGYPYKHQEQKFGEQEFSLLLWFQFMTAAKTGCPLFVQHPWVLGKKEIAGANHSLSSGVVYKGGLWEKSRLEKKRLWDCWELPKLFRWPPTSALMLTGTLPYCQRRRQNMLRSIGSTSISDTRPHSMVFYI